MESPETKKTAKSSVKKDLIKLAIKITAVITIVFLSLVFVIGIYPVHGNTMYPMLKDGDLVITLKVGKYQRGQAVAYKQDGKIKYGRIVGIGGDHVEIDELYLINGQVPSEEVFYQTENQIPVDITLNENEVYVLGDLREQPEDSRTYGALTTSGLKGHVIFLFRWRNF